MLLMSFVLQPAVDILAYIADATDLAVRLSFSFSFYPMMQFLAQGMKCDVYPRSAALNEHSVCNGAAFQNVALFQHQPHNR